MSDEERRAPKAKVDPVGEDTEPRAVQEQHDDQDDAGAGPRRREATPSKKGPARCPHG